MLTQPHTVSGHHRSPAKRHSNGVSLAAAGDPLYDVYCVISGSDF